MKTFLEGCKSARAARKQAPWSAIVHKVAGGYMAWEFVSEWKMWKSQK